MTSYQVIQCWKGQEMVFFELTQALSTPIDLIIFSPCLLHVSWYLEYQNIFNRQKADL